MHTAGDGAANLEPDVPVTVAIPASFSRAAACPRPRSGFYFDPVVVLDFQSHLAEASGEHLCKIEQTQTDVVC